MLTRGGTPERLAKMHAAVDDLEAKRLAGNLRVFAVNEGIRGKLAPRKGLRRKGSAARWAMSWGSGCAAG
jgi:hypothetical protein